MKSPPASVLLKKALGLPVVEEAGRGFDGAEQEEDRQALLGPDPRGRQGEDART